MNDLLDRSPVLYRESADGKLVFGNKNALEPGGFIELVIGTDTFRVPVDDKGFYRWEAPTPYADGEYSFSIRHFDAAGNRSTPTLGIQIVDTTPPDAPELIILYDDQGAVTGSFDPGKATDDKRPTLTGIAQKGSTVYLLNDKNEKIGSAVADKVTGKWVMEPSQDLKDGINSLRLMAEETFGKQLRAGAPSAAFDIVIVGDNATVTITDAFDDAGSFTGALGNGALTDDATPTLRGEVSAADTVIVYYRLAGSPTWAGSATATASGDTWSWTSGSNLPYGRYEFQASTGDVASALFELEIASPSDIVLRPRFETVIDDFGDATGLLESGAITDDATPTFQGRAEANSQVVIRYTLAGGAAASVTVDADSTGRWSWTPDTELAAGQWSFDVKSLGQTQWNDSFDLIIVSESDGGFAPVIDYAVDDFGPVTGNLGSGSSTDDSTPTLRGRAEANSIVMMRYCLDSDNYITASVVADSSGNWQWTPNVELSEGRWVFEVQHPGQADWNSFTLTIDSHADFRPTIEYAIDNVGPYMGRLENGVSTDDTTPTLHGTAEADSIVFIQTTYKETTRIYSVKSGADGKWQWTPPSALAKGDWDFQVSNKSDKDWGNKFELNVDYAGTITPEATRYYDNVGANQGWKVWTGGSITNDPTPLLEGTYLPNQSFYLVYTSRNGQVVQQVTANSNGIWQYQITTPMKDFDAYHSTPIDWTTRSDGSYSNLIRYLHHSTTVPENQTPWTGIKTLEQDSGEALTLDDAKSESESSYKFSSSTNSNDPLSNTQYGINNVVTYENHHQTLDLSTNDPSFKNINIVNISGNGTNVLKLDLSSLLQHSEKNLLIDNGNKQLVVQGDHGDTVQLEDILPEGSDISEWQHQQGTVTVAGVEYEVYSHGDDAELLVQQGVKTELI
ncbi:hypothetical protein DEU53_1174 [Pantoea sp. AG1095]|uniref:Ig-like domain-containing protein n=1 Tax=Pantoea sp. AG1095 TaxID=2184004 RepID=UPI000DA0BE34|nr:Ig-like domain-containing protein [Pantoea sp. AG1095]PYG46073.1 hypothetical protein DEU53_1174 [Pantoea sp. AG1095]